jgi:hypothetical protein
MEHVESLGGWRNPVGQPGDLADVVVGVLSLANVCHKIQKVSKPDFYRISLRLAAEFPDLFSGVVFTQTGEYVYSKVLGDALERALRLGVEVMNPRFYYIGVHDEVDAARNLNLIRENAGKDFVEALKPIANRFVTLLGDPSTVH